MGSESYELHTNVMNIDQEILLPKFLHDEMLSGKIFGFSGSLQKKNP